MSLAQGGQTLLTRGAFDVARRAARDTDLAERELRWVDHGLYSFKGIDEPVQVFEVGEVGLAPLAPPPDSAKVRRVATGSATASAAATPALQPGATLAGLSSAVRRSGVAKAVLVSMLLLVAVVATVLTLRRTPNEAPAQPQPAEPSRIVVLPFDNLGPSEDAYFAAGMSEELTSRLAALNGLQVVSVGSDVRGQDSDIAIRDIRQELGVGYVLRGAVRWARPEGGPSRVRITPQLIRTSDESVLWADSFDRLLEDIFEVQSDIASRVLEQLDVTLLGPERAALQARPTDDLEAYQAYLRGLFYSRVAYCRGGRAGSNHV
jgi:TolB-like protein